MLNLDDYTEIKLINVLCNIPEFRYLLFENSPVRICIIQNVSLCRFSINDLVIFMQFYKTVATLLN